MTRNDVHMHRERAELALKLETLTECQREELIKDQIIETGGTLVEPGQDGWGPHTHQIDLLGVQGEDTKLSEAIRIWIKRAIRIYENLTEEDVMA